MSFAIFIESGPRSFPLGVSVHLRENAFVNQANPREPISAVRGLLLRRAVL
jgi:hypothetical protein